MAHSLPMTPATTPISNYSFLRSTTTTRQLACARVLACHAHSSPLPETRLVSRRMMMLSIGVGGALAGIGAEWNNANAAARRPPPPPPGEKKDPNISGVQAKILASKKRKEAMKETVAKLRQKGKPADQPPLPPPPSSVLE